MSKTKFPFLKNLSAFKLILLLIIISQKIQGLTINSCPTLTCSDTDFADDVNDSCVELQLNNIPRSQTIKLRECKGDTKKHCSWGHPDYHSKMAWPFSQAELLLSAFDYYSTERRIIAKCITEDEWYKRGQLYPDFPCILDLECRSNKCYKGWCQGASENQYCQINADCFSGLYCFANTTTQMKTCKKQVAFNKTCTISTDCWIGYYCHTNNTCMKMFNISDTLIAQTNYQCESGGIYSNKYCQTVGYYSYGSFYNTVTRTEYWMDLLTSNKCPQMQDDRTCGYYTAKSGYTMSFNSPFLDKNILLYGAQDTNNCMCDSGTDGGYCMYKANSDWKTLHKYYRDTIAPKIISTCHTDFRFRPDIWLYCKNTKVSYSEVSLFMDYLEKIVEFNYQGTIGKKCIKKISPYYTKTSLNANVTILYSGKLNNTVLSQGRLLQQISTIGIFLIISFYTLNSFIM